MKSAHGDTEIVPEAALGQCEPLALGWGGTGGGFPGASVVQGWRAAVPSFVQWGYFWVSPGESHVLPVLCSASFNPGGFKPKTTGRDVQKDF